MKINEWMSGLKTHSSFADRTLISKQKGWFHTNIYHNLCRVPKESVLSQPTALAHVHITHKRCLLSGCVWMGVYVRGNWTICVLLWVRERWVKMRKNNLHPNSILGGCAVRKLNMTQESTNRMSIHRLHSEGSLSFALGLRTQWDKLELPTQNLNTSQLLLNVPEWIHQTYSNAFLHVANRKLLTMPYKSSDPCEVLHTKDRRNRTCSVLTVWIAESSFSGHTQTFIGPLSWQYHIVIELEDYKSAM